MSEQLTIGLGELIDVACSVGMHLTLAHAHHALRTGRLRAVSHKPVRITRGEANRFLNALWAEEARL